MARKKGSSHKDVICCKCGELVEKKKTFAIRLGMYIYESKQDPAIERACRKCCKLLALRQANHRDTKI